MSKLLTKTHSFSLSKEISHSRLTSISTEDTLKLSRAHRVSSKKDLSLHDKAAGPLIPFQNSTEESLSAVAALKFKELVPSDIPPHSNPSILLTFEKACSAVDRGDILTAVKSYNDILAADPEHFQSLINIGVCYMKLKQPNKAIGSFENAIRVNPSNYLSYFNKALAQLSEKMYSDAWLCMVNAINMIKNPPGELFQIRDYAMFKRGKIFKATKNEKAILQHSYVTNDKCDIRNISTKSYSPSISFHKKHEIRKIFPDPSKIILVREYDSDFSKKRRRNLAPNISKSTPESSPPHAPKKLNTRKILIQRPSKKPPLEIKDFSTISNQTHKLTKFQKDNSHPTPEDNGFFQEDISQLSDNKCINDEQIDINELKKSIDSMLVNQLNAKAPSNLVPLETKQITEQQLRFLISEYSKPQYDRNYTEIDNLLGVFPFFQDKSEALKRKLYEIASISSFAAGEAIFRQGDAGDQIYIIIKGSVTVLQSNEAFGSYEIVVNSLYDGKHFGDIAIINGMAANLLTRRTASCTASEHSYLLSISKTSYQDLILPGLTNSIETKSNFFCKLPLFKEVHPSLLAPLACNIEKKKYLLNDIIVRRGETPRGLYIVTYGTIVLYTQGLLVRERFGSEYANAKIRKPKPIGFVGANFTGVRIKTRGTKSCFHEYIPTDTSGYCNETGGASSIKIKKKKPTVIGKDSYLVKDEIPYATLQPNDYFGGRVLFSPDNADGIQSKFTVIAKSAKVKVYIITKNVLGLLAPAVALQVRTVIEKSCEIDCPPDVDTAELDSMFGCWQEFKKECVEEVRRNKYLERNKTQYPYMR